jgi:ABC-type Fe3+ transport system permease subunit
MAFDVSVAITWILFLALFPMAFFWLRRAWRIGARRDYSEVALKRGEAPPDPRKWAPFEMAINALAGLVVVVVIVAVLFTGISYETWTAIAGSTIWSKFMLGFALSRHAHGFGAGKKA